MWTAGGRILGTTIIALALHAGDVACAATGEILSEEAPAELPGTSVAGALPQGLPPPEGDPAADVPRGPRDADIPPTAEAEGTESGTANDTATASPVEPVAPSEIAGTIRARLEARAEPSSRGTLAGPSRQEQEAIAAFYTGRDFAPLWFSEGRPVAAVAPVIARLQRASEDALDLAAFPLPSTEVTTAEAIAEADIALTDAVVAYGRQASGSRVDPGRISRLIGARPEVADAAVVLALVSTAGDDAGEALRRFNPPHAPYAALRDRLEELRRDRKAAARAARIPEGPVLRVGMRDPRVTLVRGRLSLAATGDAAANSLYDAKVAAAVARFQKANGLEGSGLLNTQTVAMLSGARPSRIEAEVIANMERWRWMPRELGETRIEVNIPDFEAVVVEQGTIIQRHRVVVGKEKTPTPIFSESMRYLIVNPYWNIPPSIIRNEYGSDPGRLRSHGYEVFSREGRLAARQAPGEKNALGRIKFMFPNDYAVYMHDTPSRALFGQERRAYSHGCVRVDEPFRFAETVLGKGWSKARLEKLIGGKERYVTLPKALPVHIQYFTAYVDGAGELRTREDLYGYSRRVRAALGLEG